MKSISRYYNTICKQKYLPLGFSICKPKNLPLFFLKSAPTFARITGDVIQTFTFKRSQYVPTCTVEFGVMPLCMPQPLFLVGGGYELGGFTAEQYKNGGWIFDPKSDESITNCIVSLTEAIDSHLMPFFVHCSSCKAALPELIKLEELFEQIRLKTLHLMGESDRAAPLQERSLFDDRKYFMALKSHNVSYAKQFLDYKVTYLSNRLKSFDSPKSSKQPDVVIERFQNKLELYSEQLERLETSDFAYFDNLVNSNESQMRQFLASQYPNLLS